MTWFAILQDARFEFGFSIIGTPTPYPSSAELVALAEADAAKDFGTDPTKSPYVFGNLRGTMVVSDANRDVARAKAKDTLVQELNAGRTVADAMDVQVQLPVAAYWRPLPNGLHQVFGHVKKKPGASPATDWTFTLKRDETPIATAYLVVTLDLLERSY